MPQNTSSNVIYSCNWKNIWVVRRKNKTSLTCCEECTWPGFGEGPGSTMWHGLIHRISLFPIPRVVRLLARCRDEYCMWSFIRQVLWHHTAILSTETVLHHWQCHFAIGIPAGGSLGYYDWRLALHRYQRAATNRVRRQGFSLRCPHFSCFLG